MMSSPQQLIKGFKGKGDWAKDVLARLQQVHAAMHALSQETKTIKGYDFLLVIHNRSRTNQKFLHWRLRGRSGKHVTWETIAKQVAALPPALAQWYREANAAAITLRFQEMALRHELMLAKRYQETLANADQVYERA